MKLNISEAILRSGVSRATFYNYIKKGVVSVTQDATGAKFIDTAELVRVFGELKQLKDPEAHRKSKSTNTEQAVYTENTLLKKDLDHAREMLSRLEAELRETKEREKKAEERLDAVLLRLNNSTEQPKTEPEQTKRGLFGLFK